MRYRSPVLKVLTWNILHGGGANRMPRIALAIIERQPDVVALTEFRSTIGGQIQGVLADHGLEYQLTTTLSRRRNGILLASRYPLRPTTTVAPGDLWSNRWLEAMIPDFALRLAVVHVPDDTQLNRKAEYWHHLLAYGRLHAKTRCLVLGDFNTGRRLQDAVSGCFACEDLLGAFCTMGYRDAFRLKHPKAREYSWVSPFGSGFRIDGAYVSPLLRSHVAAAEYSHEERIGGADEPRASDHSLFLLSLSVRPSSAAAKTLPRGLFLGAEPENRIESRGF
ncbi:MAG: endonuclease/exonuclease/phosphatase family protein [Phycisphaerales bacterium]